MQVECINVHRNDRDKQNPFLRLARSGKVELVGLKAANGLVPFRSVGNRNSGKKIVEKEFLQAMDQSMVSMADSSLVSHDPSIVELLESKIMKLKAKESQLIPGGLNIPDNYGNLALHNAIINNYRYHLTLFVIIYE